TIGVAHPLQVKELVNEVLEDVDSSKLALHFHDTRGLAAANSFIGLELGVKTFDSSAGGLGGCPYARGASGNVASEDLWYLFESSGFKTGVDIVALKLSSVKILSALGKQTMSKYLSHLIIKDKE